jgi:hypothetical protein
MFTDGCRFWVPAAGSAWPRTTARARKWPAGAAVVTSTGGGGAAAATAGVAKPPTPQPPAPPEGETAPWAEAAVTAAPPEGDTPQAGARAGAPWAVEAVGAVGHTTRAHKLLPAPRYLRRRHMHSCVIRASQQMGNEPRATM